MVVNILGCDTFMLRAEKLNPEDEGRRFLQTTWHYIPKVII
jgi:hypothetical protein